MGENSTLIEALCWLSLAVLVVACSQCAAV